MSHKAKTVNLSLTRGSTWAGTFLYQDEDTGQAIDLTGYKARMQIRTLAGRQGLTTTETLVMELTTENDRLQITPALGKVDLLVSSVDTLELSPLNVRERYVYALELVDDRVTPAIVVPFMAGRVTVHPEITR